MTFVYKKKDDRVIPGNKAKIINVQCCFYFFFVKKLFIYVCCVFLCIESHRFGFTICYSDPFDFVVLCARFQQTQAEQKQKKNKIVLFANKLLNIIILKRKQNVSNCEYFKQNQSNANENERKKERDNTTAWNENSNKTDSEIMIHAAWNRNTQCTDVRFSKVSVRCVSVRLRFDKSVVIICVKRNRLKRTQTTTTINECISKVSTAHQMKSNSRAFDRCSNQPRIMHIIGTVMRAH